MSMTTLLTLSGMFASLNTVTPPISYSTKLDTWMVSCIIFVFGSLFEFTIVIFLKYYLVDIPKMLPLEEVIMKLLAQFTGMLRNDLILIRWVIRFRLGSVMMTMRRPNPTK